MPHPSDGDLLSWIDGELEPPSAARVQDHLEGCVECRERADVLTRESQALSEALVALDEQLVGRSDPGPIPLRTARRPPRRIVRRTGWSLARAAALILVAAGAAAALVPGSPMRSWIDTLLGESTPGSSVVESPASAETAVPPAAARSGAAALSVVPQDGAVVVKLRGFGPESNVHVRLSDGARAAVRVEGEVESPRFVTGPGLLEAIGADGGNVWVELPRSAREAVLQVDGEVAVRVLDGELRVFRPLLDSLQADVVFRIGD